MCILMQSGVSKFVNKKVLGLWLPIESGEVFSGLGLNFDSGPFRAGQ
jgi:hypothetical protein